MILDILAQVLIVLGALVFATATLGISRFPDPYMRVSAVGTAGGVGVILVVTGALLMQPTIPDLVKVVVIIFLQLATSAVGSIAIARSAYLVGTPVHDVRFNDLPQIPFEDSGDDAAR